MYCCRISQLFDCTYPDYSPENCLCAECGRARGERTEEAYEKVTKPEYSREGGGDDSAN
jgi:hypothetical protein